MYIHFVELSFNRYELMIVGHSLGAGAATLLSIILKQEYPELKCFAYSPPGGLLSLNMARYTEDFICSVVLGQVRAFHYLFYWRGWGCKRGGTRAEMFHLFPTRGTSESQYGEGLPKIPWEFPGSVPCLLH